MQKELVVIGGGPGGSLAALRAARSGMDVALVEKGHLGGCCLNTGCIPGKALVHTGELVHRSLTSQRLGIQTSLDVDFETNLEWRDEVVGTLRSSLERTLKGSGVDLVRGRAKFSSSDEINVLDEGESIRFERAIVATGSQPIELPGFSTESEAIMNSDQLMSLDRLPNRLLIVGAGYIGLEMGTALAKLGVNVTVVEAEGQILPGWDQELVRPIRRRAEDAGIDFHMGFGVSRVEEAGADEISVLVESEGETMDLSADMCLVAVGREPFVGGLGLDNTEVTLDESGFIETDETLRTEDPDIYAAGDVAGGPMLAHKAYRDAVVAVDFIRGGNVSPSSSVPEIIMTDPPAARVGMSPGDAESSHHSVGKAHFKGIGVTHTQNESEGFARVVIHEGKGIILGADIVGSYASELIHEFCLAMEGGLEAGDMVRAVRGHPTFSEIITKVMEDAGAFLPHSL